MLLSLRHGVCYFTTKYAGRLTVFSRKDLLRAAAVQPQAMDIWNGALDGLAQAWLRHSYMLQQRTPRQRLLAFFRWEAERQGGEKDIRLPLPQTDLADYLGVDRAAMAPGADKDEAGGTPFRRPPNMDAAGDVNGLCDCSENVFLQKQG